MMLAAIGWALIHSLWQGGLIAVALACALALARRAAPSTRYALSLAALALAVALPAATVVLADGGSSTSPDVVTVQRQPGTARAASVASSMGTTPPHEAAARTAAVAGSPIVGRAAGWLHARIDLLLPWLVAAWAAGLLVFSARLTGGVVRVHRLARTVGVAAGGELDAIARRIADRLGVRTAVRVLESTRVHVPLVVGWVRPVILLPVALATGLTPAQLETLIAHELAHIRRHDVWLNLLQSVVETLLFYHPAVWWMSEQIREAREQCCDDLAIAACRGDVATYASALVTIEEWRGRHAVLASAATGGSLLQRVVRLVSGGPAPLNLGPRWIAGVVAVTVVLVTMGEGAGVAAEPMRAEPSAFLATTRTRLSQGGGMERLAADSGARGYALAPVMQVSGGITFNDRWARAERAAAEAGVPAFWLGYAIGGPRDGGRHGNAVHAAFVDQDGEWHRWRHDDGRDGTHERHGAGISLPPLLGERNTGAVAILLGFERYGSGAARLVRVRLARYTASVHLDGWPLLWLGKARDGESIARLQRLVPTARWNALRRELVAAIGVHGDAHAVVPALTRVLDDRSVDESVREAAAEWLGAQPDGAALVALAAAARSHADRDVRRRAIAALGHMERAPAADTLAAFVGTLDHRSLRRAAVRALGHRTEARTVEFLGELARSRGDRALRFEAIESLEDVPDGLGVPVLATLARHHPWDAIRREAVEQLGHAHPDAQVVETLAHAVWHDHDGDVRREAVESLGDLDAPRARETLAAIATSHLPERVQRAAARELDRRRDGRAG